MGTSVLLVDSSEGDVGTLEVENDAAEVKVSVIVPKETPVVPKNNQTNDESEFDEDTDSSVEDVVDPKNNQTNDESESYEDTDSSDEDVVVPKKKQKDDESESEEDTDSSDEDVVVPKKPQKDDESESDEDTDSSDEDVPAPAVNEATLAVAKEEKESSDDPEDESSKESNEEEPKQKMMNVQQTDVEMVDSQLTPNKEPTILVTPKVQTSGGSKTVFIGNVPFSVENTDMENFFKEVGGVVDVRFAMHTDGSKKGFGHVEFVSADAAKKAVEEMNGKELMGCRLRLSLAMERVVYTPQIGDKWNSFLESEEGQGQSSDEEVPKQKKMKAQQNDVNMVDSEPTPRIKPATPVPWKVQTSEGSKTVFVGNLHYSAEKADMEFFFKDVGEVVDVRFAIDSRGKKRDFGHVEFASAEAAKKAVEEMNGKEMMGRALRLDLAKEREVHAPQRGEDDVKMVTSEPTPKRKPVTPVPPKVQTFEGSKTVFVGNLHYSAEKADMKNFFKEVGEVVDVHLPMRPDGLRKCFGHIEFASADAAKKAVEEMNGKEMMGRGLRLELAKDREVHAPQSGVGRNSSQKSEGGQGKSSDEEEPKSNNMKLQQKDVGMVDSELTPRKNPATPVPAKFQTCEGSKTVFVGNLHYSAEKADMEFFFKDVGEVVDVRFAIDSRGKKRDFGHVEFASAEAAKKAVEEMNGKEMMGRALRLDLAKEREVHAPQRGEDDVKMVTSEPTPKRKPVTPVPPKVQTFEGSKTVFVGNLHYSAEKADMKNFFKEVGEVVDVHLPMRPDGLRKCFGHIEFASADAAKKAVEEMNGKEMMGRGLRLELAKDREVHAPQSGVGRNSSQKSEGGQGKSSDEEEPKSNNMKLQQKDVGMVDSELTPRKNPATPVPAKFQTCEGSKTVFVGNLHYSAEKADMEFFFKDVGEVVDVRFAIDSRGKKRDFGHVEFASAEAAKKAVEEMNGKEMMGRALRLDLAKEREVHAPQRGEDDVKMVTSEPTPKKKPVTPVPPKVQNFEGSKTVFVGNLHYSAEKADMKNFFKEVGEVVDVHLPMRPDGLRKCFGHIEFASADAAKKAVEEMNGKEMMGRGLRLELAKDREVHAPQSGVGRNSSQKSEGGQGKSSDEEEPKSNNMKLQQKDVGMVDSELTPRKNPATPVPAKFQTCEGSKTVFVGNLHYSAEKADMEFFFKDVGEVVDVRFPVRGRKRDFAHVVFASAEAAKKAVEEMNGKELMGRGLRLNLAMERDVYTPQIGDKRNSFPKSEGGEGQSSDEEVPKQKKMKVATPVTPKLQTCEGSKTVFVENLPYSVEKTYMKNFFKEVGEVVAVRLGMRPDGSMKGIGHIEFASADAAKKAVEEMNGKEIMGRALRLDLAKEMEVHAPQIGDKRNSFPKSEGGEGQSSDEEVPKQKKMKVATPVTPKLQTCEGSKTVFVGNLPYSVEKADMDFLFKDLGEVVDVRLPMHPDGLRKGFGHIEFASADAAKKAVEKMNGKEMMGRALRLDFAKEREESTPQSGVERNSFQKSGGGKALTIFIRGLDINDDVFKIKEGLIEHFGSCGEITRVHVGTDPEGRVKGTAYMDFIDNDAFKKALELHQSEFGPSLLLVEVAKPKFDNNAGGSWRGRRR